MNVTIAALLFSAIAVSSPVMPAWAQSSSSESSYYRRGYGSTNSNVFVPRYKERLQTWTEQIEMGRIRGWLTAEEIQRFTAEHARLAALKTSMEAQNYPKTETDALEHQFNSFNVILTQAMSKPAPTASASAAQEKAQSPTQPLKQPTTTAPKAQAARSAAKTTKKTTIKKKVRASKKLQTKKSQ